jgi:RNA polymerase sigma factor (sigma-70 family)
MNLETIIAKCKTNDRNAQHKLFDMFSGLLLAVSKRYTPLNLDAEDNLQDGFIKIFQNMDKYDPAKANFESWARKIVIHCALSKLKLKRNSEEILISSLVNFDAQLKDEAVLDQLSMQDLHKMIESLPDGYRQVFCLYEIEGYSHAEIGEMLNIKEVSSRTQLSRSKKLLQTMISKLQPTINLSQKVYYK